MNMKNLRFFIVLVSLLALPSAMFAATNDFTASSNVTVSNVTFGSTVADMLILSGSTAESWLFSSGTFSVTNPGTFKVGSSDSSVKSIQVSQSGSVLVCSENTTPGTSYATLPTSSGTYTVAPSATSDCTNLCTTLANTATYNSYPTCGAATCNEGYWLSGSGANATCERIVGAGVFTGTVPNLPKPRQQIVYPDGTIVYLDENASPDTSTKTDTMGEARKEIAAAKKETGQANLGASFIFTKALWKGMKNNDVKKLQELLASDSSIYPEGITTGYFGRLTEKAVQRFQEKYGIVSSGTPDTTGYGLVGPKTMAKLNEIFGGMTASATPAKTAAELQQPNPAKIATGIFITPLFKGMSHPNVKRLQRLLNSKPDTRLASSGVGAPGNETNYFGSLTEKAVQKFQEKYGIAGPGNPGYGYVGPMTREKLNEIFGPLVR
ncbi:MAG: peptidoglycan-binding protein [bacterium]|nr:peptidoglycan-binding protein [bacterium]